MGRGAMGPSALDLVPAKRCSRAFLLAAVSRAKRGVWSIFGGLRGVCGIGVAILSGMGSLERLGCCRNDLLLATLRGAFSNTFSFVAEVGRSSKESSSWPSP